MTPPSAPDTITMKRDDLEEIKLSLRRAANELNYCIFHFENGTSPCMWGAQEKAKDACNVSSAILEAALKQGEK